MGIFDRIMGRRSIENPTVPVSSDKFLAFFGQSIGNFDSITIDLALTVPAYSAGVSFLSRTMAALPLHAYRNTAEGPKRIAGGLETLVHEAPNPAWTSFKMRQYFWQQVFTGGRGLAWIERSGSNIVALWPMNPAKTQVLSTPNGVEYIFDGRITYKAAEVIDIPFMLKADGVSAYGPVTLGSKALGLALAMNDYAGKFFAGGGVPPLVLVGPMPAGPDAMKRAMADISRSIDTAKSSEKPVFAIPPGYELKPVGFDPEKGQMTDARRFQVEEIARVLNLPPVFLQDLTHGTFSNTEQQDLHLVKHLVAQWAEALEEELDLKLFGQRNGGRYVEHNLDGLMRGDFATRMEGLSKGIQNAILTPNEARALENRPALPKGDELLVQGATVPLGQQNGDANGTTGADEPA